MKFNSFFNTGLLLGLLFTVPSFAFAAPSKLTLKTDFKIWDVSTSNFMFTADYSKTTFRGLPISLSSDAPLEVALDEQVVSGIDLMKIQEYLNRKIAPDINRAREDVSIRLEDGKTVFEGKGLYGRTLDIEKTALLIKAALENDVDYVNLPIRREDPVVTILSQELRDQGIKELVSAGETNFEGSPNNRRHNIKTGLSKFVGHVIKQGEEFVFGDTLGEVDGTTGYLQELVIKGDRTIPEYGGGLCQVSTTAYRAILAAGFPVTERHNHSFAVHYYSPTGLDATVYPPTVNLKFINDGNSAILMQSFMEGDNAYFNFYGTKDKRKVSMIGPFYSNYKPAPPARTEYTDKLAPGETQKLGNPVPGVTSNWFRKVTYLELPKDPFMERIFSNYQARPLFTAIGGKPPADGEVESSF